MTEVAIADFQPQHLAAVMAIERALFPLDAWTEGMFESELAEVPATRRYWVAVAGDEVVGYAGVLCLPPEADIQTIAVAADWQRHGIGRRLLDACATEARERGCRQLYLEVLVDNAGAIAMYRDYGFSDVAERPNYYGLGRHAAVMKLELGGSDE